MSEPGYLTLYRSGELAERARRLEARLAACDICPRQCGINRRESATGFCRSGYLPVVASICAHHGEEPALSGTRGSGTIFFGNCNMRCIYCQNYQISQDPQGQRGKEVDFERLAGHFMELQRQGCHNVNLVTPSHFVPQIVRALLAAIPAGFRLPLVYNTSGYDSPATLQALDGIVDIYLPDIRYASNETAVALSQAPRYVECARTAIKEMHRQVGDLVLDDAGIAKRGVIVRHLILPNGLAGSAESLTWLSREVSPDITVSIMSQYFPTHRAAGFPRIARPISRPEYNELVELLERLGLENGWLQEMGSADCYLPDFSREAGPFQV